MRIISDSLSAAYALLSGEGAFLAGCIIIATAFAVNLILSLTVRSYVKKKRRWFYFLVPTIVSLQRALSLCAGDSGALVSLIAAFSLPLVYVSLMIKEKPPAIRQEQLELARYFDKKARDCEESSYESRRKFEEKETKTNDVADEIREPISPSHVKEIMQESKRREYGLDFSHVKNVMSRLDYFSLSQADKRQVKELEVTLAEAENGDFTPQIKERLNDGLGSLLKIMSKYGV